MAKKCRSYSRNDKQTAESFWNSADKKLKIDIIRKWESFTWNFWSPQIFISDKEMSDISTYNWKELILKEDINNENRMIGSEMRNAVYAYLKLGSFNESRLFDEWKTWVIK